MGRRITEEQIIQINKVYLECGVKSKTAQIVGVSPSTVTKYLIPGFTIEPEEEIPVNFDKPIYGAEVLINKIKEEKDRSNLEISKIFCNLCMPTKEEWEAVNKIQEGINI